MAAGQVAETAVEAVADVAEAVSEESEHVAEAARLLSSHDLGLIVGGLGVGVVVGCAGGYILLRKRLETKYSQLADEEVAGMREHFHQKMLAQEGRDKKEEITELEDMAQDLKYKKSQDPRVKEGPIPYHKISEKKEEKIEVEVSETPETRNLFEEGAPESDGVLDLNPDWDYEAELKNRDPAFPYVVHQDEYKEGSESDSPADQPRPEYEKVHLTYFEGDDILSDQRDQVVDNKESVVGVSNLSRFGHGSGDPNIVYIRNDQLECDIEVTRSTGNYATEVHGFQDDEIKHSSMRRRLPRRSEYDDMES